MSPEKIAAAIRVTIDDIDEELAASVPLLDLGKVREFDFIETAASASILQSFYTGIENLLLYLCKTFDGYSANSPSWHRELLESASEPTTNRSAIIDAATRELLIIYLDFRHVVRHGYARRLRPDRTRELLLAVPKAWATTRRDFERFTLSL